MAIVAKETIEWCKKHKMCVDCKFQVYCNRSPTTEPQFSNFVKTMNTFIKREGKLK